MIFFPERLPVVFDFVKVVVFALSSHRVKTANVNQSIPGSTALPRRHWPSRSLALGFCIPLLAFLPSAAVGANISRGFNQLLDSVVRIDVREVAFDEGTRRFEASIG